MHRQMDDKTCGLGPEKYRSKKNDLFSKKTSSLGVVQTQGGALFFVTTRIFASKTHAKSTT